MYTEVVFFMSDVYSDRFVCAMFPDTHTTHNHRKHEDKYINHGESKTKNIEEEEKVNLNKIYIRKWYWKYDHNRFQLFCNFFIEMTELLSTQYNGNQNNNFD